MFPIQDMKLGALESDNSNSSFPKMFRFKVNGIYCTVAILDTLNNGICNLSINGYNAYGVIINNIENIKIINVEPNNHSAYLDVKEDSEELVLVFEDKSAYNEVITGRKGASLSILNDLSKRENSNFVVPKGLIVTTNCYQILIRDNPHLREAIEKLEMISW